MDSSFKIYTRTGDKGTSSLYTGERRKKDDDIFQALGAVDELSSVIGICSEYSRQSANGLQAVLTDFQCACLDMGSNIATPRNCSPENRLAATRFDEDGTLVKQLEDLIDELESKLPPLANFILPSGGVCAGHLHVARTVCRRAERSVVPLVEAGICDESVARYLNRMSDFLFVAARYAAHHDGKEEMVYKRLSVHQKRQLVVEPTNQKQPEDTPLQAPTPVLLFGAVLLACAIVAWRRVA
eukprot:comp95547_c0_seq1/m.48644 comp95547_c0_seq1/g.48644  ORF comp95547_c0_seq1/g.48644 comp95547_c0_seq1/m.48644 type:complete len:241 (-) comp95547_c0_seq1:59-781(-)